MLALGGFQAVRCDFLHGGAGHHGDAELLQGAMHRGADALRQGGQHAGAGLDQGDAHVLRLDAVQAVGGQFMCRVVQLGGQFDAGGAGADYGDADLVVGVLLGVGAQVVAEQLAVEALGLLAGVEEDAVLGRAFGTEVVGGAADRQDQAVVGQLACGHEFAPVLVMGGGQLDDLALAVQPAHAAELELEVVPLGLGDVVQLVLRGVERTGRHFMQQGFPYMG
ncbi:hypothetical protein D9M71_393220 [compost metagenome]